MLQCYKNSGLLCNISGVTPLVQRTRSLWISSHHNGSDIILHDHCPLNYCKPTRLWLRLDHSDQQCAQGRSGILPLQNLKPQSDNRHFPINVWSVQMPTLLFCYHCTSWTNASVATDHLQPHCLHGNNQRPHQILSG